MEWEAANFVANLVAFECSGTGILLGAGTFELQFATSVRNGGIGIQGFPAYQGVVGNSISWTNATNFGGFNLGQVVNCNGDRLLNGILGNMFVVPGFRNEAAGDLQLTHNCPMVDVGDLNWAYTVVEGHLENSRILDDDLNSVAVPDRGAYELCWCDAAVTGEPRIGHTLTFVVNPHLPYTGLAVYTLGALDGVIYTQPWGFWLVGSAPLVLGTTPIGSPLALAIPDSPPLIGLRTGVQAMAWPLAPAVLAPSPASSA